MAHSVDHLGQLGKKAMIPGLIALTFHGEGLKALDDIFQRAGLMGGIEFVPIVLTARLNVVSKVNEGFCNGQIGQPERRLHHGLDIIDECHRAADILVGPLGRKVNEHIILKVADDEAGKIIDCDVTVVIVGHVYKFLIQFHSYPPPESCI